MATGPSGLTQKDLRTPMGSLNAEKVIAAIDGAYAAGLPAGPAGGDLGGTYPNPAVVKIQGINVLSTVPLPGQVLAYTGADWEPTSIGTGLIARRITVGLSGADHTSISDAIADALSQGAGPAAPYVIEVYPGTYVEQPFTVPSGIVVTNVNGSRNGLVNVVAANPAFDLVTGTGGIVTGLNFLGVTDPTKALIRISAFGQPTTVKSCSISSCSNGIIVANGAVCLCSDFVAAVFAPGQSIGTCVSVDGVGSTFLLDSATFSAPGVILPLYGPNNPIDFCVQATNGASVSLASCTFAVAGNNANQVMVHANGGSIVGILGSSFSTGRTAIQIGAAGSTTITALSTSFASNTINIESLSANATIFLGVSVDDNKFSLAAGTTVSGSIQNQTTKTSNSYRLHGIYGSGADLDVLGLLFFAASSSVIAGGALSDGGGLTVNFASGAGAVRRSSAQDTYNVSWAGGSVVLPADSSRFIIYQSSTSSVVATASTPGAEDILLGQVITGPASIRFIHKLGWSSASVMRRFRDYTYETRRVILRSGLAALAGTTNRKISVDPGSYWLAVEQIAYAGTTDATFSAFYGTDGVNEISGQTDVNITQYDNAGTLTAMTAGFYRSDTLYLVSDGRLCLIFGTEEFATQVAAADSANASPFSAIEPSAIAIASVIVQEGVGIVEFVDRRPMGLAAGGGGAGGASDHSALSGLSNDDHPQYLLTNGSRALGGPWDLANNNITSAGLINGVDIDTHASRHQPGGLDAIAQGAPSALTVGGAGSTGSNPSFANSGHIHAIARGTPVAIGSANSAGTAAEFAGADHVHAHGAQTDGTMHAAAVAGVSNGFITAVDQTKLNGIAANAAAVTASAPANVTKAAAAVGVSADAARADHKHDITTAAAIELTDTTNAEGSAASLARSDHTHAHGIRGGGSLHAVAVAGVSNGFISFSDQSKLNGIAANAAALTSTPPANVTKSIAAVGVATDAARADHKHDISTAAAGTISVGDAAAEGAASSLARSDHTHALPAPGAPADVTKAAASAGISTNVARADHKHDVSTGVPVAVGLANAEGTATSLARSDHVHASRSGSILQTTYDQVTADVTVTSAGFNTLMSRNITVQSGSGLNIFFTASSSNSNTNRSNTFQIIIDGVTAPPAKGTQTNFPTANGPDPTAMVHRVTGLTPGSHTVAIRWTTSNNTGQIFAATSPEIYHASLLVQETSA